MVASVRPLCRILPTQVSLNNQIILFGERATEYAPSDPIQPSARSKSASRSGAGVADLTRGGPAPRSSGIKATQRMHRDRVMVASVWMRDYTRRGRAA